MLEPKLHWGRICDVDPGLLATKLCSSTGLIRKRWPPRAAILILGIRVRVLSRRAN